MGRPRGSIDKRQRKTRTSWNYEEVKFIKKYYHKYSLSELSTKLGRPKESISCVAKDYGFKKIGGHHHYSFEEAIKELKFPGVYGIENHYNGMIYIGSSVDISHRIGKHWTKLKSNNGGCECRLLQNHWDEGHAISVALIEKCNEDNNTVKEMEWIKGLDQSSLYNVIIYKDCPRLCEKDIERFWDKVEVNDNVDSCWEWSGYTSKGKPYGKYRLRGKYHIPSRISYLIHNGPFDAGYLVCHTCDNKKCCNPHHLFLGSHYNNVRDHWDKVSNGDRQLPDRCAGLQCGDVRKIYELCVGGKTYKEIGEIFNIGTHTVFSIINNKISYLKSCLREKERERYLEKIEKIVRRGRCHKIEAFGETKNLKEWAQDVRCVVCESLLRERIRDGVWNREAAIITPSRKTRLNSEQKILQRREKRGKYINMWGRWEKLYCIISHIDGKSIWEKYGDKIDECETQEEYKGVVKEIVGELCSVYCDREMASFMGCRIDAWRKKRQRMGIINRQE